VEEPISMSLTPGRLEEKKEGKGLCALIAPAQAGGETTLSKSYTQDCELGNLQD